MTNERELSIYLLQEGLYLAATLPYTHKYIREQVAKYGHQPLSVLPTDVANALSAVHAGLGIVQQKQTEVIGCICALYKQHDATKAMHEALYMLRNILCNDTFKVLFKDIERKTPRIQHVNDALAAVKERALIRAIDWHDYTKKQVTLLYHFISVLYTMKQITAMYKDDAVAQYTAFSSLDTLSEDTYRLFTELALLHVMEHSEETTTALTLLEGYTIDPALKELVHRQGIHMEQLLASTYISQAEQQSLTPYEHTPQYVSFVVQTALLKLVQQPPAVLPPVKELQRTEPKQEAKQKRAKVAPAVSQKELHTQKFAFEEATAKVTALEQALQQQQAQYDTLKATLHKTEQQLEEMSLAYKQLQQEQQPHAKAISLIDNIQTMMNELQQQLHRSEPIIEEKTMAQALAHLKIAVVGGHQNFHVEMKKRLPAASLFIGPDELHFDERKLLHYDVVVLAIHYCNHSLYERVFDYMKRQQAKQKCVITQLKNIDMIAEEIYYRFIA